ncbi:Shikimate kinase I [Liberibacter crescens BT-1]|uniref:Shikimate kinase n=1 Tax=Liberibacter crescens (strain BT-1) TaxID=1215343 RepID=L0EWA8_LIBCB|nr:shikimate kinase [Liberibacter crescens]AGA65125.1 Shikimate kinase I [Liberibacter crescens BT-1]AMC13097.1 shikimate kinase [Liberibacter crescens]
MNKFTLKNDIYLRARAALGKRNLILVGLMGAGKTVIGQKIAGLLEIPFIDTDHEIESVSSMTIVELFNKYGENEFRALEARVIKRILQDSPYIVATGGGAFINEESRSYIKKGGICLWLKADLDLLWKRVKKRNNAPLLKTDNPKETVRELMQVRYQIYEQADIVMQSLDLPKEEMADKIIEKIVSFN